MRFGIALESFTPPGKNPSPESIFESAELAESLGFDSVWAWDHILLGSRKVFPVLDTLSTLASVGARTKRLKLGTSVLIMALRNPVVLAKVISTIQYLSGCRIIIGAASGCYKREFEATGIDYTRRGRIFEERFNLVRQLLDSDDVNYDSDGFLLSHASMQPRHSERVPMLCGGYSEPSLRRAGKISDGWIGYYYTPNDFQRAKFVVSRSAMAAVRGDHPLRWVNIVPLAVGSSFEEADAVVKDFTSKYMDLPKDTPCTPNSGVRGTIKECIQQVKAYESSGVSDLVFIPCFYEKKYVKIAGEEILAAMRPG